MPLDIIKQMAYYWNQNHCLPLLNDYEFNRQWNDALKFLRRNINRKTGESGDIGDINNKINNGTSHGFRG